MTKLKLVELVPGKLYQIKTLKSYAMLLGGKETLWYKSAQPGELKTFLILDVVENSIGSSVTITFLDAEGQVHTQNMDKGCVLHNNITAL